MEVLVQAKADLSIKCKGMTPLFLAATTGSIDIMHILAEAGSFIDQARHDGATPIYAAASNNHPEVVSILVAKGALLNPLYDGKTPLYEVRPGS